MTEDQEQPFTSHLEELRRRLIVCLIAVSICFLGCWAFSKQIFHILMLPLLEVLPPGEKLIYTGLPEAFFTYLKVAFLAGILLAVPVIMYQFWMFVAPGLYEQEKRWALPVVFFSSLFFIGGALFGYFVVFPFGFKFFLGFADETIRPMPTIGEYLGFSTKLLFAFGLVFELPLAMSFLVKLGVIDTKFLKEKRKYAIVIFFVFAAILTPPDVITQLMMAGPLMLLYEVGILASTLFSKK